MTWGYDLYYNHISIIGRCFIVGAKKNSKKTGKKTEVPIITYEEYLSILILATKIRNEKIEDLKIAITPDEKVKLLKQLFEEYPFLNPDMTTSRKKSEEAVLLKNNIFIPDSFKFLEDYQQSDKNIRELSEKYQLPAPFIIHKISEIGFYISYIEQFQKEQESPNLTLEKETLTKKRGSSELNDSNEIQKEESNIQENEINHRPLQNQTTSNLNSAMLEKAEHQNIDSNAQISKKETIINHSQPSDMQTKINSEIKNHYQSMEQHCLNLLSQNNELTNENVMLHQKLRELEQKVKNLLSENQMLRVKNAELTQKASLALPTENMLRQRIKSLEISNVELQNALEDQTNKTNSYRKRVILAEAQLEHLYENAQGIEKQVDAIELISLTDIENSLKTK